MNKTVIIAGSAGSIPVIKRLLEALPKKLDYSVIVLVHQKEHCHMTLAKTFNDSTIHPVVEPEDGTPVYHNFVYVAPPSYHLQVEPGYTFSFALDGPVNYSRPSIDVLLETAAWVYKENVRTIILSGASKDGAQGAKTILAYKGKVFVQDPDEAEVDIMPSSVIKLCALSQTYNIKELSQLLKHWRD